MPKRSNEFQHLVALIESILADSDARVTESKELNDNILGKPREVDIVIERNDGVRNFVVSIECSGGSTARPSTVEWVERMWGKHSSLPTNKLVLVSQSSFTDSAWLNIDALSLKQAQDYDWESVITKINEVPVQSFLVPYIIGIKVIFEGDPTEGFDANDLNSTLYNPDGKATDIFDLVNGWLAEPAIVRKLEEIAFANADTGISFERKLKEGCYLIDKKGVRRTVLALQVNAKCRKEVLTIPLGKGTYGKAQIAHGRGTIFGRPIQLVFAQKQGKQARVAVSIKHSLQKGTHLTTHWS